MKYLFLVLLLSGCSIFQDPVIQTKLVYIEPPKELLIKPDKIENIDPEKTTEKEFSKWLIDNFSRYKQIELQFDKLIKWNETESKLVNH